MLQKVPILILFDFPKKIVISIIVTSLLLTVYEDWLPINELCSRHIYSNRLIVIRPNLLLYCQTFKARVLFSLCQLLDASTHNKSILCICSSHLILQGEGTARHQATVSKNDTALACFGFSHLFGIFLQMVLGYSTLPNVCGFQFRVWRPRRFFVSW